MSLRTSITRLTIAAVVAAVAGCSSFNRMMITRFEPIRAEPDAQIFKYTVPADAAYPLDSERAERTRIEWLETWLKDNGYSPVDYEITSRQAVLRKRGVIGDAYDIYYEVRAHPAEVAQ